MKPKIAVFHSFLDNIGGAEMVALTLAKELNADIYTTNIDNEKIEKMGFGDIFTRIYSIGKIPKNAPFRHQLAFLKFRNLNLGRKYDFYIIAGDWAMSAAVNNKPNLWYVHSPLNELWAFKKYIKNNILSWWQKPLFEVWVWFNRYLTKKYSKHVGIWVCNSKNTQNRIKKYYNKDAVIINPPIETKNFYYKKNGDFWLSVNRLLKNKRVDLQIKTFSKLHDEKLIVVGSYEKSDHFLKYADYCKKIKPKNVEIRSWVGHDELRALYAECKGFITTSKDEDFGMNVLEAMASGKPVIAPNEGGYKETIIPGKTGLLIDDINENNLAEEIEKWGKKINKNPLKFKKDCQEQAENFDAKIFIKKIKNKLKNCGGVSFLSHEPHEAHLSFAKAIGAKIKITPFKNYLILAKKIEIIGFLFPAVSFLYALLSKIKENIVLVDGGSSLYIAVFLKIFKKTKKIIYLDGDTFFYNFSKETNIFRKKAVNFFIKNIDGVISVSEQNKERALRFINCPTMVAHPYPKTIKKIRVERKNYGLYVGRLDPVKKIERVINFALQCPYIEKFIIIGNGPLLKKYVIEMAKKYNKILYLGQRDDVEKFYSKCKFFIHLPDSDSYPVTTMEAATCGCFPIISKGSGTKHLFDEIFIVNNPDNFDEINKKMGLILKNEKKYSGILKKSLKKIVTKEKAVKDFEKKFNKIIELRN